MAKELSPSEYAKKAFTITMLMALAYISAAYFGVINAEVEDVAPDPDHGGEEVDHHD
jgi:hypothetical protein